MHYNHTQLLVKSLQLSTGHYQCTYGMIPYQLEKLYCYSRVNIDSHYFHAFPPQPKTITHFSFSFKSSDHQSDRGQEFALKSWEWNFKYKILCFPVLVRCRPLAVPKLNFDNMYLQVWAQTDKMTSDMWVGIKSMENSDRSWRYVINYSRSILVFGWRRNIF